MKYVHRVIFHSLLISSLVWACFALKSNPFVLLYNFEFFESLKLIYILGFTAIFWPIFYVEVADYLSSVLGRNGKLYKNYAKSIQKDIVVSALAALVLSSIYWLDLVPYSFSGVDLGFVGFPFLIHAIYTYFQIMKIKIAGKPVRKTPVFVMLVIVLIYTLLSYSILIKNSSGGFEAYQAVWFQLTILFASFFIFANANLQLHLVERSKFELSPFKKYFFNEVIKTKHRMYVEMEDYLNKLNSHISQEKAKNSAFLRKKGRKN